MVQGDSANGELKITCLDGFVYQTLFEYEDKQYWIGADYYPTPEGFLVSYKAGLVASWFSCSFEYGGFFPDLIIQCAEEDIERVISAQAAKSQIDVAKRVLHMAYNVEDDLHAWSHNGNEDFYERFRAFPQYTPHPGKNKSILLRSSQYSTSFYFYCHIGEENIQVLGTESDSSFSKVCDIAIPDQYQGSYAELIESYYAANRESLECLVRTGKVPTAFLSKPLVDPAGTRKMFPPHRGNELLLWPDPAYTFDVE